MSRERCIHCGDALSIENDSSPLSDHCTACWYTGTGDLVGTGGEGEE